MLLPLELTILSNKKGYVSPELALGWRVGKYIREFFTNLHETLIATTLSNDAILALKLMAGNVLGNGYVTQATKKCRWDFLVYHPGTGTALKVLPYHNLTELPGYLKSIEDDLPGMDDCAVSVYRDAVNDLIINILHLPMEVLCRISEHRCRRIMLPESGSAENRHCPRCGRAIQNADLWEVDGNICCLSCSGLEPSWFVYH